jgi:hypothetical protein
MCVLPVGMILNGHDRPCCRIPNVPYPDLAIITRSGNLEGPVRVVIDAENQCRLRVVYRECRPNVQ